MDTRFQPEGLSFDNNNHFNINPSNNQYPLPSGPQQDQYFPQQQLQYSHQRQQSSQIGLPTGPRLQTPQQQGPYGLPSGPRLSNPQQARYTPQPGQQVNNFSRVPTPQQQQEGQTQQRSSHYSLPAASRQDQYPLQSSETTRSSNTWVQTPAPLYPSNGGYFSGPVDNNGYPVDNKEKQQESENPFRDSPSKLPSLETVDLEKHKPDNSHSDWDKHTKIPGRKDPNQPYLPFGQRLKHYTWANYTLTMATGGLGTLIAVQPHPFPGLMTIGAIFYALNLMLFTAVTMTMILRFTKFAGSFKASIAHEREGLFLGPFFLSVATIITGTQKYIIEAYEANHPNRTWAVTTMSVAFWTYTFFAFCLASFQYSFLFCRHTYKLTSFMPSWLLPIFPIMLSGTIASVIAKDQPVSSRMPILVAGMGCQGLGFTVAILMYAHYIGRLMQVGYPDREHRGAMFIAGKQHHGHTSLAFC